MGSPATNGNSVSHRRGERERNGIWIVVDFPPTKRGSMEDQLLALAARLRSEEVPLTYVFAAPPAPWFAAPLATRGVQIEVLDFRCPAAPLTFFEWMLAARPRLVHFHFVRAYSPLVLLARAVGAQVLVNDHLPLGFGYLTPGSRNRLSRAAITTFKRLRGALLNPLVTRRVAVSSFVASTVQESEFVEPSRVTVLEHGIDLDRFTRVDGPAARARLGLDDGPLVVCVGRLALEKGIDVLIQAHAQVETESLLALVGSGPDEPALRQLAAAGGRRVRFVGLRDDVADWLAAADVVVQPSRFHEAFGLSVVEAMACGKPIAVTNAGAMPELVDFGRAGLVVPRGDASALAGAISTLLTDGPRAKQLAEAARRRAAQYQMRGFVERVVALYDDCCPGLLVHPELAPRPHHIARAV